MCFPCPEISTHSLLVTNAIKCFCATDDRFCAHYLLLVNHPESVGQKGLNPLLATMVYLSHTGRYEAGGGEALCDFLFIQHRNHHTLFHIGRDKSEPAHSQLSFHLATSHPRGKHLVCLAHWGTPEMGCRANPRLILTRELICTLQIIDACRCLQMLELEG